MALARAPGSSPVRSFDVDECVEADAPIKVAWQLSFDPEVRSTIATTFCYADSTIATTFVPLGPQDQCLLSSRNPNSEKQDAKGKEQTRVPCRGGPAPDPVLHDRHSADRPEYSF